MALVSGVIRQAPLSICFAGVYSRTSKKYGAKAPRYVAMETGHAGQNVCLQALSLGLCSVPIGGFADDHLKAALHLSPDEEPLYVIPVGYPAEPR